MSKEHIISADLSLCNSCGLCRKDCPHGAWVIGEAGAQVITQDCLKCGHCVAICPRGAVAISGFAEAPQALEHAIKPEPENHLAMMKGRRSIRHFTPQEVPPEIIGKIIEAGRYTPTGRNRQGVSYTVLREQKDEIERLGVAFLRRLQPFASLFMKSARHLRLDDNFLFKGAPVVIVGQSADVVDGALAASVMELLARAYGLGVLYSGMFAIVAKLSRKVKRELHIPDKGNVVTALVLGYPALTYHRTAQREQAAVRYC
jgi:nitroreductase/NAD-dependent dihydropyrimidine dehydrogenase PreA subunit